MATDHGPQFVIFNIEQDGKLIECIGQFGRDPSGPYADNPCEVATGTALPSKLVRLDEKSLRRGPD
jgi:hypothetical protein